MSAVIDNTAMATGAARALRVAIIDDEPLARAGVRARLAGRAGVAVVGEYADGVAALDGIRASRPDLVFIDVDMPGKSGLDVLAALAPGERPMAILLTAYDQFALAAFSLDVVDYLLKPIDEDRFDEALERAWRDWPQRRAVAASSVAVPATDAAPADYLSTFTVRVGVRRLFVDAASVDWIEADGDYAVLHVDEKTHLVREPLQRLALRLNPAQFVRVHRQAIVRLAHVSELRPLTNGDAMLRLRDGTPVRASRTYVKHLLQALQDARPP